MTEEVSWLIELLIRPGKLDEFRILTSQMTRNAKTESGIQIYERFIDKKAWQGIYF